MLDTEHDTVFNMEWKKAERLRGKLVAFIQQYRRKGKAQRTGRDPNDRKLEERVKPEDLDELLND